MKPLLHLLGLALGLVLARRHILVLILNPGQLVLQIGDFTQQIGGFFSTALTSLGGGLARRFHLMLQALDTIAGGVNGRHRLFKLFQADVDLLLQLGDLSVALLEKQFGWPFFEKLRANGARIGKGSGQVIDDTASGELGASLAVDYITYDKIKKGAHIALYYPPELLIAPSPVAIFKGGRNLDAAKKFVDYLLSKEAQTLIAAEGTLSVRADVPSPEKLKLPPAADALKRSIKIDYVKMMESKKETIKKFTDTLQGKK